MCKGKLQYEEQGSNEREGFHAKESQDTYATTWFCGNVSFLICFWLGKQHVYETKPEEVLA